MSYLFVFLGGGIGAVLRFILSGIIEKRFKSEFPLATLSVNIAACILMGVFIYLLKNKFSDAIYLNAFLITGICGGFSTFSTFAKENLALIQQGFLSYFILNTLISIVFCMFILYLFQAKNSLK